MGVPLVPAKVRHGIAARNEIVRGMLAEMAGIFVLVLFVDGGLAGAIVSGWVSGTPVSTAFSSGMGVAFGIYTGLAVSGGHVNPAITVGLASVGKFPWRRVPLWILAQLVGAFCAASVVFGIYYQAINNLDGGNRTVFGPTGTGGIFCTYPQPYFGIGVGFVEQIINTGLLLHCTLMFFDERNGKPTKGMEPFFVGLSVAIIILAWGHNAGAPMNPARDLAGRLVTTIAGYGSEVWTPGGVHWWWIPTFVPPIGGIFGANFYHLFIEVHHPDEEEGPKEARAELQIQNEDVKLMDIKVASHPSSE